MVWAYTHTNKDADCHNITEILLKVVLNIINQAKPKSMYFVSRSDIVLLL